MGTRNLTIVVLNKKVRVAQYAQWDGYPTGQGIVIAKFLDDFDLPTFKKNVASVTQVSSERLKMTWSACGANPNEDTVSCKIADIHDERYPQFSRNTGAGILKWIELQKKFPIELDLQLEFAGDSLFCEWAYVLDLDNQTVEVYKGFNKKPLKKSERFYQMQVDSPPTKTYSEGDKYFPIAHVKAYDFDDFTEEAMVALEKELDKDDE